MTQEASSHLPPLLPGTSPLRGTTRVPFCLLAGLLAVACSVDNGGLNADVGGGGGLGGAAGAEAGAIGGIRGTGGGQGGNATAIGGIPAVGSGGIGGVAGSGAGNRGGWGGPPPLGHGGWAGIGGGNGGSIAIGGHDGVPDGGRDGQAMGGAGQDGGGGNTIPGTGGQVPATGGNTSTGGNNNTGGAGTGGNPNTGGSGATGLGGRAGGAGGAGGAAGCSPTTCMNGCCENNLCVTMRTVDHCGNDGAACAKCAKCFRCGTNHSCEVDPASPWKLVCTSAVVSAFKSDGMTVWDPMAATSNPASAPPDPVCQLKFGSTVAAMTSSKKDTLTPSWNESITPSSPALTASRLMSQSMPWSILISDDDEASASDTICQVSPQLTVAAFTSGTAIVTLTAPLCFNITLDVSCNL